MAVALLIATPGAIASSGEKVDSAAERPGMSLKSGWAAKGASEGASAPLRVSFDKALRCLALNIYHEARSEPRAGQIAVASVTLNRVKSKRFPGTVCDVVKQGGEKRNRCQFSWWCDGKDDEPINDNAWKKAEEIGRLSLMGITNDPTDGALFYHADYVKPSWSRAFERSARIGDHLFYKLTKRLRTAAKD